MGLFGPKKSNGQKAYEKVYDKFPSKKVSVADMEKAIAEWESADGRQNEVWKAYFKIALTLECGLYTEPDPEKAARYHEKVRAMIKESGNEYYEQWERKFYAWYNESGINIYRDLDAQTCSVRRLGNAEMNVLGMTGNGCMLDAIDNILGELWFNTKGVKSTEASAFKMYTGRCNTDKYGILIDHNSPDFNVWDMKSELKEINEFAKRANGEKKEVRELMDKNQLGRLSSDCHQYIYGFQFFNQSPYSFATAYDNVKNPLATGIDWLLMGVYTGNSMALHKLVYVAKGNNGKYHDLAEQVYTSKYRSLDAFLLSSLEKSADKGDYTAEAQIERYFTK